MEINTYTRNLIDEYLKKLKLLDKQKEKVKSENEPDMERVVELWAGYHIQCDLIHKRIQNQLKGQITGELEIIDRCINNFNSDKQAEMRREQAVLRMKLGCLSAWTDIVLMQYLESL